MSNFQIVNLIKSLFVIAVLSTVGKADGRSKFTPSRIHPFGVFIQE